MRVSVNWVKQFVDLDVPLKELVERIGSQLGAVEEVIDLEKRYKGVVIVRVVSCEKHPDADKLWVCQIDDGGIVKGMERNSQGLIQIVTGAANAQSGMVAVWIPPGAAVPSDHGTEAKPLESREFRGLISHGMLASPKELGLGDNHDGLLHIDDGFEPGSSFAKAYKLDDQIIEIENKMFTHRPDLFGIIGIARELAAIFGQPFSSPEWYTDNRAGIKFKSGLPISVKNEIPKLVPRFSAVALSEVTIGPSPIWLRSHLIRAGIRPVNNVVDLTNFVMFETGQPLHAYDLDKIRGSGLTIRKSRAGENLTLLDGKDIKLQKNEIVIADEDGAVGLGGVMGGISTEVDEDTNNLLLEAANFDMNSVRRSAMAHGLFTEASTRFSKNQSPWQTVPVLTKLVDDILRMSGGNVSSSLNDSLSDEVSKARPVKVSTDFVNQKLGLQLTASQMTKPLESVEMQISRQGDNLAIVPPFWRTDISHAEDIVEEVGRHYGYDRLPLNLPKRALAPTPRNAQLDTASKLRTLMSSAGANELLTYSFVQKSLIEAAGQDTRQAFHIRNALRPELQYYRMSLAPSLLEKVRQNLKSGFDDVALFEVGSAHIKGLLDEQKLPRQLNRMALVTASAKQPSSGGSAYFQARRYCDYLAQKIVLRDVAFTALSSGQSLESSWRMAAKAYEPRRSAVIKTGNQILGIVGEPSVKLRHILKLPSYCAMAELDTELLSTLSNRIDYVEPNRFPALALDICFRTNVESEFSELERLINTFLQGQLKKNGIIAALNPIDIYRSDKDSRTKQTAWHLQLQHPDRTLTTTEANQLVQELAKLAKTRLDAQLV